MIHPCTASLAISRYRDWLSRRISLWMFFVAVAVPFGMPSSLHADLSLTDLQWDIRNMVDNDDAPFGLGQGPGSGAPRNVRGLALSPDGQFAYLGYNQAKQLRKVDLSVGDPADSCAVVSELYFATLSVAQQALHTGTYMPDALDNPKAVATDDVGRVYVTRSSEIQVYDENLTTLLLRITGFSTTNGIHVNRRDASSFLVYAADRGLPFVYRMIVSEATISGGGAIAVATVLDSSFDGDGIVDVGTDAFAAASDDLRGLAAEEDGTVWAAENDGTLFQIIPAAADGASTVNKRPLPSAFDVVIDGDQVFVTTSGRTVTVIDRNDIDTVLETLTPPVAALGLANTGSATGIEIVPGKGLLVAIEGGSSFPTSAESSFSDVNCDGPDPNDFADDDNDPVLFALACPTTRYVAPGGSDSSNDCTDSINPCATIQHAIDVACPSGDVIQLEADMYAEGPQIVVGKSVSMVGAGKAATVVQATADTGTSGDARGWFLVPSGVSFNVSDLTLDGAGFKIFQAIRNSGDGGTIDNVRFTEIKFNESGPTYQGVAIAAFGGGPVHVTSSMFDEIGRVGVLYFGTGVAGSTFNNNMYAGKGIGDFLDYMLEISAGATVSASGNTVNGNRGVASSDGSTSAGFLVSTFFGNGSTALIDGNQIEDNTSGIVVGYSTAGCPGPAATCDTSSATITCNRFADNDNGVIVNVDDGASVSATSNSFFGNADAIDADSVFSGSVLATDNWWGSVDGPSGAGPGTGDPVTANVTFSPFALMPPACVSCIEDADCDDGLACNGSETCDTGSGMCVAGVGVDCSSLDDQCEAGTCEEPSGGCVAVPVPDGTLCDAGVICSVPDTCSSGVCLANEPDSDGDGVCDANERPALSLRKLQVNDRTNREDRDMWIAVGELNTTTSPGEFLSAVPASGIEVVLFHDAGPPLAQVHAFSFAAAQCNERRGSIRCLDSSTRSKLVFRKRSAPDFFRMKITMKRQNLDVPSLSETPLSVSLRTVEGGDLIDRSDDIGPSGCKLQSTNFKCRDIP